MNTRLDNLYNQGKRKGRIISLNSILNSLLRLTIVIILARYYGPRRFGVFSFFAIFFFFFLIMDNLWIRPILTRQININKDEVNYLLAKRMVIGNGTIIRILLSLVAMVFLWINTLIINHPVITEISFYISISLVLAAIYSSFAMIYRFNLKESYHISYLLLKRISILALIFLIISLTGNVLRLYKLALIPGFLIVSWAIYSSMKTIKPIFKIDFALWRKVGRGFQSLGLAAIFMFIYLQIDYLMLFYMKGFNVLGSYSAAIILAESLGIFLIPLTVSISPSRLKHLGAFDKAYHSNSKYLLIIVLIAISITIFSTSIVSVVYGKQFLRIAPALSILIWAEVFVFVGMVGSFTSFAKRKRITNLIFMGAAILINGFLNLILIPRYGFVGAAIATLISYSVWPNNKLLYIDYIRA